MPTQLPHVDYQQNQSQKRRRIADLPAEERPLYRLYHHGTSALATTELLALILGTPDALGLADELLKRFSTLHQLSQSSKEQLTKVRGIGEAQAARLLAIMELSRRLIAPPHDERPKITSPDVAANLFIPRLKHLQQEELHVMLLNTRNQVMSIHAVYRGSLNTSLIRIAELFRPAIEAAAAAVIVAHNHPSGVADPSPEDVAVTRKIIEAGKLLGIECLDHLIIGHTFVSLKERGFGFD